MNLEDKLAHFSKFCITDARSKADKIIADYQDALDKAFEEYKHDENRRAAMQLNIEAEKIKREGNRRISIEQTALKKQIGMEHEKLKEAVFCELTQRLDEFMKTPAYNKLIEAQIQAVLDFADSDTAEIYIDPKDEAMLDGLVQKYGNILRLSKDSFIGGTKAVIAAKNILIDNSFAKKLDDARESSKLELGGAFNG